MTTIQDRIIKDFRDNFCQLETSPSGDTFHIIAYNERNPEKYYRFLMSVIKEVEEETRKEVFDNLPKVIEPPEDIEKFKEKRQAFLAGQVNMLMRLNDLSLSITNKEIKK